MNMQNKLYTIQFSSPPDDWFTVRSDHRTLKSEISWNSWKSSNSWTREDLNSRKREEQIASSPAAHPRLWTEHDVHGME